MPLCFEERPALAAPFVAEVGAVILHKQLLQHSSKVLLLKEQVTEPAYEHAGGPAYREVCRAMESAQERFLKVYCRHRAGEPVTGLDSLREEMEQHQTAFQSLRQTNEAVIQHTRREAVRAYWSKRAVEGIPDTFFADVAPHMASARLHRLHPPWWGKFHRGLQVRLKPGHPAEGYLLDVLPRLRAQATKHKYDAVVTDWCAAHATGWGWDGKTYHRMLVRRGAKKLRQLETWFNVVAPGYLTDPALRHSLHAALGACLAKADPWLMPVPSGVGDFHFGGHGRN
ncbi:MAG: hypothetical protein PSU94_06840 [Lacunisphaera sp.]|nr:hypothetical protein [Lacunisphaera sp.]